MMFEDRQASATLEFLPTPYESASTTTATRFQHLQPKATPAQKSRKLFFIIYIIMTGNSTPLAINQSVYFDSVNVAHVER